MSGREKDDIVAEALNAAHRSGTLSPNAAKQLIDRLTLNGYRILKAGEIDKETRERVIEVVRKHKRDASFDDSAVGAMEHNANEENILRAIRSLGDGK